MCGIAALLTNDPVREPAMRRMLAALAHRGPDGEGLWADENVALGHRRLSVIDLASGAQPLHSPDGTTHLVANGEIYNYRELRRALERDGYTFLTHGDCEVIIALYQRYGERMFEHLRGMFAFVLWDSAQRTLIAARDHLGQKPLYYQHGNGAFACASEIKALLARGDRRPQLNLAALDQYFALRLIDAPLSMIEGIAKLPPGHYLKLSPGGLPEVHRYWTLRYEPKHEAREAQLLDELENAIEESLRLHLVSDVPVGAFLSGGLDSGLLVAMTARRLGIKELPTFTMGIDYARFDEAPAARQIAQRCGTRHHELRLRPEIAPHLPDVLWALDEPSDPLSLCTWLLARFTREHVKVVFGGDGGDELFGGYDRYYGAQYAGHYRRLPEGLRRRVVGPVVARLPAASWYKGSSHKLRWLHHLSFYEGGARYAESLSYFHFNRAARARIFTPEARAQLAAADAERAVRDAYDAIPGTALDRMLHADSMVRLPNHPVMITDRMCMAHGLEARSPYMDHRLAEFAARLPSACKVRGGSLRYLQRRLAQRYLPESVLERPKQGFASALPYLLQDEFARLFALCLHDSRLVAAGIVEAAELRRLMAEHSRKSDDHGSRLWLLINAELWFRMMICGESRADLREQLAPATRSVSEAHVRG
jgi:asparagine synthase (glutamine-hydrolysing)